MMRRSVTRIALIGLMASSPLSVPASPATASTSSGTYECAVDDISIKDLADGINVLECEIIGSRVEMLDGYGLTIPAPGHFSGMAVDTTEDSSYTVSIRVDDRGLLHGELRLPSTSPNLEFVQALISNSSSATLALAGDTPKGGSPASEPLAPLTRCQDNNYNPIGYRWYSTSTTFYVNGSERKPSNLSASTLNSVATTAGNRWNLATDSCGLSGSPSNLDMDSVGSTTRDADISNTTCLTRDGYNVVDRGALSGSTYGYTCWWGNGLQFLEFDTRMDSSSRSWRLSTSGCSNSLILVAGMMHEMGHAVGLDHVTERGGSDLTMSPSLAACNSSSQYLGKGDHTGILAVY